MPGFGDYALGLVLSAVCVVPIGVGAVAVRRRLIPGWRGSPAWVADAVLGLGLLTVVLLAAGAVGLLTRGAVAAACPVAGALALALARACRDAQDRSR